jgi:hypothetical protein
MEGTVYFAQRYSTEDDDMIQSYSSKLAGVSKGKYYYRLYGRQKCLWT